MKIDFSGVTAMLVGNWTESEDVNRFRYLSELSSRCKGIVGEIRIDCSGIEKIDSSGLHILYSWLQCIYFRGNQPRIVNVSAALRNSRIQLGVAPAFEY